MYDVAPNFFARIFGTIFANALRKCCPPNPTNCAKNKKLDDRARFDIYFVASWISKSVTKFDLCRGRYKNFKKLYKLYERLLSKEDG